MKKVKQKQEVENFKKIQNRKDRKGTLEWIGCIALPLAVVLVWIFWNFAAAIGTGIAICATFLYLQDKDPKDIALGATLIISTVGLVMLVLYFLS